jgi:hypothetical protein
MNQVLQKYFNEMANIIFHFNSIINCDTFSDEDVCSVLEDVNNNQHLNLLRNLPELVNDRREYRQIIYSNLTSDFFDSLRLFIEQYKEDRYQMVLVLYYMDKAIVNLYDIITNYEEDIECIEFLNSNTNNSKVMLLRKFNCKWESSSINDTINNNILKNFYYINQDNIQNIKIKNHIMDENLLLETNFAVINCR